MSLETTVLVPTLEMEIDAICDAFENSWKQGERPQIEAFLEGTDDGQVQAELLRELLAIDLHYRRTCQESPTSQDYNNRFPQFPELITRVFQESGDEQTESLEYAHFGKLRRAVEAGLLTDSYAEKLLRSTPIGHQILDTATSHSDLSEVVVEKLSGLFGEYPGALARSRVQLPDTQEHPVTHDDTPLTLEDGGSQIDPGRREFAGLPLRYELTSVLGQGGMGLVFLAFDRRLRRAVAIKVLPEHDSGTARAMQHECEILARINNRGIVSIYDSGNLQDGRPYIVMEHVDGTTLDRISLKSRSESRILDLFATAIHSVAVAHELGIVHRDLKPSNIIISDDGMPKVLDFGLAKLLDSNSLNDAQRVGTMSYASPEQLTGAPADARSDVYALGVMLYEALTGVRPAELTSDMNTREKLELKAAFQPLRSRAPRVSRAVEAIIHKCLDPDPSKRYQDAADLGDDIGNYVNRRHVRAFERQHPLYWLETTLTPGNSAFLFVLTVCAVLVMTIAAGFSAQTFWPVLAMVIGLQGGTLFLREATSTRRSMMSKVAFYLAGFILLFEGVLVVGLLARH